jgi:hypothetical protein
MHKHGIDLEDTNGIADGTRPSAWPARTPKCSWAAVTAEDTAWTMVTFSLELLQSLQVCSWYKVGLQTPTYCRSMAGSILSSRYSDAIHVALIPSFDLSRFYALGLIFWSPNLNRRPTGVGDLMHNLCAFLTNPELPFRSKNKMYTSDSEAELILIHSKQITSCST